MLPKNHNRRCTFIRGAKNGVAIPRLTSQVMYCEILSPEWAGGEEPQPAPECQEGKSKTTPRTEKKVQGKDRGQECPRHTSKVHKQVHTQVPQARSAIKTAHLSFRNTRVPGGILVSKAKPSFVHRHSLSLAASFVLAMWIVLYLHSDPRTHLGSFFGNAIADWTGLVVMILATKYMYEKGSAESRKPPHPLLRPIPEFLRDHSLTVFLLVTGAIWVKAYLAVDSEGKWGQVVGNIVSEWTQIIGTVLFTKALMETKSKESKHGR
jgi:hypothetical protein